MSEPEIKEVEVVMIYPALKTDLLACLRKLPYDDVAEMIHALMNAPATKVKVHGEPTEA